MKGLIIGCVVLAGLAALFYFLTGAGILQPGELDVEEAPSTIAYVAGAGYVVGGLLILVRKRWLWIIGAVINALVIMIFFIMYAGRPVVMFSVPGLATKSAQILLELGLFYLVVTYGQKKR